MPCPHGRQRSKCKQCGGSGICQHGRERRRCKECGGSQICQHGRRRSDCKECEDHRCAQCHRTFSSAQALKYHVDREVCSNRNRQQPGTKRKRTGSTTPLQGPKRTRKDDDIPPAPGVFDSAALVNDSHQPEQVKEQGVSRSVVEGFIIFESAHN